MVEIQPMLGDEQNSAAQRYTDIRAYASQPLLRPNLSSPALTNAPHLFGRKPTVLRSRPIVEDVGVSTGTVKYCTFANILWTVLVGWWCSLFVGLTGLLMIITIVGWPYGVTMIRLAGYIFYPFGRYLYCTSGPGKTGREKVATVFLWFFAAILAVIPLFIGMFISWELMFYIPMAKFMWNMVKIIFTKIHHLKVGVLHRSPKTIPLSLVYRSGSVMYFKHTVAQMEIPYLNLFPLVPLTLYMGYLASESSPIAKPIPGTLISIVASIPCMYVIGVCTEILSSRCGLVLGSFINAILTGLVELILFFFSLRNGLGEVVMAAVTGAFLMNLLVIPGLAMFAAGIKWKEVMINRKVQSVSGTFMFLAIVAVFFPAVFYNLYGHKQLNCYECPCNESVGFHEYLLPPSDSSFNCSKCKMETMPKLAEDEIYQDMARPLMYAVSCLMPVVYFVGLFFSLKTHKYIYEQFEEEQGGEEHQQGAIPTWLCVIILAITCTLFSIVCEILTGKIEKAIEQMGLTARFAGLVFYTLIPAVAEFINAVRFALEGNMGLSLEIGNQGAMVVSLIQMPALVLISVIMGRADPKEQFTLMFEMIDVFAIIISVMLRNFMLTDKSINYFTGFAFLVIFLLIAMVYYFDQW